MITKPDVSGLSDYMRDYINKAAGNDLIAALKTSKENTLQMFRSIGSLNGDYSYASGKWTVKEVMAHIIDTERIFTYRALTIARRDTVSLPGYDQDTYVPYSNAASRNLDNMIKEYELVRDSSIYLFESFADDMFDIEGTANNLKVTPRIIGWMTAGHDAHHYDVMSRLYPVPA